MVQVVGFGVAGKGAGDVFGGGRSSGLHGRGEAEHKELNQGHGRRRGVTRSTSVPLGE